MQGVSAPDVRSFLALADGERYAWHMKLALGHGLAGLTVVTGSIAVMAACQHDDSSLFVQDVIYPTPVAQGQSCTYTADPNQTFISHGQLDVGFRRFEYSAEFLVGNQLVSQSNSQQLQTETSTINISGAVVQVTTADGTVLDNYTWLSGGSVYPATGTVPGYAAIGAVIASPKAVQAIAPTSEAEGSVTLVTYTKFIGHTLGGTYVESNVFEFAVDVCYGCLVAYSQMDVEPTCTNASNQVVPLQVPNCLGASSTSTSGSTSVPCFPGQDTIIDCALCQDLQVCRGAYPTGVAPCDGGTGG
jgi:hypothetical protein